MMNLPSHLSPSNLAFIQMLAREKGVSADTIAGQLLNNHLRGLRFFDRRMPLGSDEWQLAFNRPTALHHAPGCLGNVAKPLST